MTIFSRFLRQFLGLIVFFYLLFILSTPILAAFSSTPLPLLSTESDPDSFIEECVNVISGEYCESDTDLLIQGPDALALQRFYSTKDPITAAQAGGWRILPQRFLVVGKDPSKKPCTLGKERFEWTCALTGERSGGILPYSGWRNVNGLTKDPLKIDILNDAHGMVNTYAKEMNGQTNHQNNCLHCKGSTCELTLGDGTKRIYQKVHTEMLMSYQNEDPYISKEERLVDDILERAARIIKKKYDIKPSGEGAAMPGGIISELSLAFDSNDQLSKECLRRLLIDSARELVEQVHMHKEIEPFLKHPPFTVSNVQIIIYNHDKDGRGLKDPNIATAEISHGTLTYRTKDPNRRFGFKNEFKETYEEAITILEKFSDNS